MVQIVSGQGSVSEGKIDPSEKGMQLRAELLQIADKIIDEENKLATPAPRLIKKELQQQRTREIVLRLAGARETENIRDIYIFFNGHCRMDYVLFFWF
jgi:ATP phosphoribosyltransferase